jgi:hypothetical protein
MKTRYSWSTVATTDESTTAPVALLAICISLAPLRGTRFAECGHQSRRAQMPRYFVRHPGGRHASSGLGAGMDDNPARETQREQFLMLS